MGMSQEEKDLKTGLKSHITLPKNVEDQMQEAYQSIRGGSGVMDSKKQIGSKKYKPSKWIAAAAAIVLTCTAAGGVLAATGFFNKNELQDQGTVTYQFDIDYELKPGVFQAEATYLPEAYKEQEENKYWTDDNWGHGFSILPIYNTVELEKLNSTISKEDIEEVEKATLAGMEAHIITMQEEDKYRSPKYIYLFNPQEGYVVEVYAAYGISLEEVKKFVDGLVISKISDTEYESPEEKEVRLEDEQEAAQANEEYEQQIQERNKLGIQKDQWVPIGKAKEVNNEMEDGTYKKYVEFTILEAQFTDSLSKYDASCFYDYSELEPWLNKDGTLKSYTRQHWDEQENPLEEEEVEQQFLIVKAKIKKYRLNGDSEEGVERIKDTGINANLVRMAEREDGSYTWPTDYYEALPSQENNLQRDRSSIYFDQPEFTEGDSRKHFFFRTLDAGDELEYTLIFVVDRDLKDSLVLEFQAFPYAQGDMSSEPVYFSLKS